MTDDLTLLLPLNSSWSKSKCRHRAPTVKSERSSAGLLEASTVLFGSSWCCSFSLFNAPSHGRRRIWVIITLNITEQNDPDRFWNVLTIVSVETRPHKLEVMGDLIDDRTETTHTVLHNLRKTNKTASWSCCLAKFCTWELLILSLQLTVMPYLMMSFIRSSSMVVRKLSLGWSIKGTTSSRILATLQITIKSLWVCRDTISTFTLWPLDGSTTPLIAIHPEFLYSILTLHFVVRYGCIVMACFTISWGRILLNRYSVVIQATKRLDVNPLFSQSAKHRDANR